MAKHTVPDHFVGLALKGLINILEVFRSAIKTDLLSSSLSHTAGSTWQRKHRQRQQELNPWHSKVRDKEEDINLTKNYYIKISLQKIISIHKLILKINTFFQALKNYRAMFIFDHAHPKIIVTTFTFAKFVLLCKKSVYSICSFLRYSQFQNPATRLATPIFYHGHPKNFQATFICMNLYQHAKNWLIASIYFSDTVSFRVQRPNWPHPFFTMPNQEIFNQLFGEFVSTCKK